MDALAYIEKSTRTKPAPLFVLTGDEDFLKRQARDKLIADLLDNADPEFAMTRFVGESAVWSTVKSDLDTLPFVGPRRLVLIEQADPFVTANRGLLEKYVAGEAGRGVLIIDVKTWASNTRLAKATPDAATLVARAPTAQKLASWCKSRATNYRCELTPDAAEWLVELIGNGMGQLDQEIAKLASFVGEGKTINREHVDKLVGRTRQAETFKIFDAIGNAQPATALAILHRLFEQNEDPLAILGAFSWQLRRLASVSRLCRGGLSVNDACDRSGVPPFARRGMEQQLRHLGRARLDQVYEWMVDADLAMKGSSELPRELTLEKLVVQLARPQGT